MATKPKNAGSSAAFLDQLLESASPQNLNSPAPSLPPPVAVPVEAEAISTPTPPAFPAPTAESPALSPVSAPAPPPEASVAVAASPEEEESPDLPVAASELNLAQLLTRPTAKKPIQARLTDAHASYLNLISTVLGPASGPSLTVPDLVHNIIEDFFGRHDAQLQRAIQQGLRKQRASMRK